MFKTAKHHTKTHETSCFISTKNKKLVFILYISILTLISQSFTFKISAQTVINVPTDFSTIQSAIDASQNGDTILVASGTYKETLKIIDKSLTLKGNNRDGTIIDGENDKELPTILVEGGSADISGFTVKNGVDGIRVENSLLSIVSDNIITNNFNSGINLINSPAEITNNVISNNQFLGEGTFADGIRLAGSDFLVEGNNISKNANEGIAILDDSDGLIKKNTISNNESVGLLINNSKIEVVENIIKENLFIGILVGFSSGLIIDNNINNNSSMGITLIDSFELEIKGNFIEGNSKSSNFIGGIAALNTISTEITDNNINDNIKGILLEQTVDVNISNNNITNNSFSGVLLLSSKDIDVINNIINSTGHGDENESAGIFLKDTIALIKGNNIELSESDGIKIIGPNSIAELIENSVKKNDNNGILCDNSSLIIGCCNDVSDNKIDLNGCSETLLECPCPPTGNDKIVVKPSSVLFTHFGASTQLSAILESNKGASLSITEESNWLSSDPDIVSVDTNGLVTAEKNGKVIVCSKFDNIEGCMEVTVNTINAGINQWTTSVSSELLGEVKDIVIDPFNSDIIYVGTNSGSVFKSIDKGKTWIDKSNGLLADSVKVLSIDPFDSKILYAGGTQNLYKTFDGGENWNIIRKGVFVTTLAINNLNADIIYIGSKGDGVLKSINGGETLDKVNNGLEFNDVRENSLIIDPINPNNLYAAVESEDGNGQGVFKTVDGALNWRQINNNLPLDVRGLAIDPVNPAVLYAGTFSEGIFKTVDGGNNWFELENSPHDQNQTIAIDNRNLDVIYVGNSSTGVFTSRNAGETWERINTQLTSRTILVLKVDPLQSSTIYAGTSKGVFNFTHAFNEIETQANPDGTSIDIIYKFNEGTGINPIGFNIYRSSSIDGDFDRITDELLDADSTSFRDRDFLKGSTHVYRMTVVSDEGETLRSFSAADKPLLLLNPDFIIDVVSDRKEVVQGDSVGYAVNLISQDGFKDEVSFTTGDLPTGVTSEFILPDIVVPPTAITLEITTATSTPIGEFKIEINGKAGEKVGSETVTLRIVEAGSQETVITTRINANSVTVGDQVEVTGEIIPLQNNEEVTAIFTLPDGNTVEKKATTNEEGIYSIIKEIDQSGIWQITSSWNGNNDFKGATSDTTDFPAAPAITTIAMFTDADFETKQGDTLTLKGKINPNPGNEDLFLEIDNIDGSINFNGLIPIEDNGEFSHEFRVSGGESGRVIINARFDGNKDFVGNSREISIPIQEPAGMVIIVAGGGNVSENTIWDATNNLTNYAYRIFKNLGIPDGNSSDKQSNRIFFLHPNDNNDADGDGVTDTDNAPTPSNLQNIIEKSIFELIDLELKENGNSDILAEMPLTIYMMGPGDKDVFSINENEDIKADDLDQWLDNLFISIQNLLPEDPSNRLRLPVNIIMESPRSGSFLDNLSVKQDGIGNGRTVVTSTDECEIDSEGNCKTGKINISGDGLTSFSGQFLYGIKVGKSITTSWSESNIATREIFDNQRPQIDANGNGISNESDDETNGSLVFVSGNRFQDEEIDLQGLRAITANSNGAGTALLDAQSFIVDQKPVIIGAQKDIVLDEESTSSLLWTIVDDPDDNLDDVQAIIFPPDNAEPEILTLSFSETNKRFESPFNRFNEFGIYNVLFVARDKLNNMSLTKKTIVASQFGTLILSGMVFNSETLDPLGGAIIKVRRIPLTFSDPNGNYLMRLDADDYTILVCKNGFKCKVKKIQFNKSTPPLDIGLDPKK